MDYLEAASEPRALGPYQLGLLLGKGGMGEVYKAYDDRLGRQVAVKRLHGGASARDRERLRREARILARLGHPGIVQVFDIVEDDESDWIVMELVDGPTLAELGRDGPLDVGLALDYARQIASALVAAHLQGIVHRDLKTENVMVLPSPSARLGRSLPAPTRSDGASPGRASPGRVKILDFGVAHWVESAPATASRAGGLSTSGGPGDSRAGWVVGTPRTMSPEQASGHPVDTRSDLFSLGVLLYEILTARSPFSGAHCDETLRRVITHRQPPAQQLQPLIPRRLSELVDRLLEKDPSHRPQTAARVEAELAAIAAGDPVHGVQTQDPSQIETIVSKVAGDAPRDDAVVTTLLLSDLVGSTRLVEALGDREAAALFRRHDRLARDALEEYGGREIDKTDGFLLIFDRPWSAVRYALSYHQSLSELGLAARVGIHLGEVILHRNIPRDVERGAKPVEVEGLAKPTAARLMSLAVGGQTLLTRAAYEVARRGAAGNGDRDRRRPPGETEGGDLQWRAHGRYRFQGISDDVEVFEAGIPGTAPLVAPAGSAKVRRVDDTRLASRARQTRPRKPATLRCWPPPELPEHPYPVLLPYTHPDLMAGRDQEIARLRRLLEMPVPILGLSAPSGTGKSSLLIGGLVPTLRAARLPVALLRHPAEAGVASRLIGDLLDGAETPDDDPVGFVERLVEVERLAGAPPILVLDQLEDLLREDAKAARTTLGPLMAASVARRPGLPSPPCRWLIAYRQEYYGQLDLWLGDVLADARAAGVAGIEALPYDLSQPERFHGMTLPPLAKPSPSGRDPLADSTRVFLAAIEKPLAMSSRREEAPSFPWQFPSGHAERLARAFAEARLARSDAPLVPELQVVLAHLLAQAGPEGRVNVPDDPGPLIDAALDDHLRRAVESAFPEETALAPTRRARALLVLSELASSTGQRDEGLRPEELIGAIGEGGEAILEKLATPLTRLVVVRQAPDGPRWVLAHDRMAEAVVRLVAEEGRHGQLLVDAELLSLRRFVTLRTALYRSGEGTSLRGGPRGERASSTRVSRRCFQRIEDHAEALLWDDERRAWFMACRQHRRHDRRRLAELVTLAVLVVTLIGWGTWAWAHRIAERRALLEQVIGGEPGAAFQTLDQLAASPDADFSELLALLRLREVPMDVLERGLGGLDGSDRSAAVLRAVEIAMPWVEETPEDPVLIANLVWALDFAPARDPPFAERALALRDRVLEPLRRLRPPPPLPVPEDPEWIHAPAGSFLMGTASDEPGEDDERPRHEVTISAFRMLRHEVTNAEYQRLVPGHPRTGGDDALPAAFMSWYAAYVYAAWLGGRLPTEAEWEYAAWAGCPHAYCTRDGLATTVDVVAWTLRSLRDAATGQLAPRAVMRLEANPWGLYDMLGNLWEWTADGYQEYPGSPQRDPWSRIAPSGGGRIGRGGCFGFGVGSVRVACRNLFTPGHAADYLGFRVVLPAAGEPAVP